MTLIIGVLFADVRNSTALGETLPPHEMASSPTFSSTILAGGEK